jgi:hypothetical protein
MTGHIAIKKFLAAGGLALGVAGLGMSVGGGIAAADGMDASNPAILDDNGTQEVPDTGSYDELESSGGADGNASHVSSTYPAGNWSGSFPGGNARP